MAQAQYEDYMGCDVFDSYGEKIGTVQDIYLDDQDEAVKWATVSGGFMGMKHFFVPLEGAHKTDEGLKIPYEKDLVNKAPNMDPDGHLSRAEEDRLYQHYNQATTENETEDQATSRDDIHATAGHDTSGPTTDEAMTRSEEEMRVSKSEHETGRARLRKHIVTEKAQMEVPLQKEVVRMEREPITEENRSQAMEGPDLSEEGHEVVLREERPVVDTAVVPKERVKLTKDTLQARQPVFGEVRKEVIEPDLPEGAENADETKSSHENPHELR